MGPRSTSSDRSPVRRHKQGQATRAREVARFISVAIGNNFFRALVEHLAETSGASCALVGEFAPDSTDRVRTVAVWMHGGLTSGFEYDIDGSFSAAVEGGNTASVATSVRWEFPADPVLARARAEAAIAVPLISSDRELMGLLLLAFTKGSQDLRLAKAVVEVVAGRAAAELEHKRIEERLQKSEQRYQAFIAHAIDGMWRIEFDPPIPTNLPEDEQVERMWRTGYIAELNDAMARLLGYSSVDEVAGTSFGNIVQVSNQQIRDELRGATRAGYKATGVEILRVGALGTLTYRLRSYWGIVDGGELRRIWGTTRDVTELRQTELRLHLAEQQYRELADTVQLLLILSAHGNVIFCNDALCQTSERPVSELVGRNWFDHAIPPDEADASRDAFRAALEGSCSQYEFESVVLTREGRRRPVVWVTVIMRDTEGKACGATLVGRAIPESPAHRSGQILAPA